MSTGVYISQYEDRVRKDQRHGQGEIGPQGCVDTGFEKTCMVGVSRELSTFWY